jgi:hypothetical protein
MLVYRSSQRCLSAQQVREGLQTAIDRSDSIEALLRSGELECALADMSHSEAEPCARLCDALALRVLGRGETTRRQLQAQLNALSLPESLTMKTPEGYAYYALSPLAYARLALSLDIAAELPVAVLGVRSIGTSLSAIVSQSLREKRRKVERISVRPSGDPWQRELRWTEAENRFVMRHILAHALFLVVDEGPGMSGSTFLAVAEALEASGVAAADILLLCSHPLQPERLVTSHAIERFARYRSHAIESMHPEP